jgi:hypothetical protein
MRKKTFPRITKTLGVLVFVSLIMFLTATSASASNVSEYQKGYNLGFKTGHNAGINAGKEVCLKHGQNGVLTKIPAPIVKKYWTKNYKNGYIKGFKKGYIHGYNETRYKCLKTSKKT